MSTAGAQVERFDSWELRSNTSLKMVNLFLERICSAEGLPTAQYGHFSPPFVLLQYNNKILVYRCQVFSHGVATLH
jgi:hypothetical protein